MDQQHFMGIVQDDGRNVQADEVDQEYTAFAKLLNQWLIHRLPNDMKKDGASSWYLTMYYSKQYCKGQHTSM